LQRAQAKRYINSSEEFQAETREAAAGTTGAGRYAKLQFNHHHRHINSCFFGPVAPPAIHPTNGLASK